MSSPDPKFKSALGFLTIINHPQHGFFGGYLMLNTSGFPLEFHCTMPVKPNRAQEILYGPTLESFLYGEQIGQTLLAHSDREPLIVCTDCKPALAVQQYISWPVALVLPPEQSLANESEKRNLRINASHGEGPDLLKFDLGRNCLALRAGDENRRQIIVQRLCELAESFDLFEPFGRIREAIEEAQHAAA